MIKIDRRGYKQRLRILAITTERLYIITKKNPYPKEQLLFKDLLGVYCTPYKDGFICLKTKEVLDDRVIFNFSIERLISKYELYFRVIGFFLLIIHVNSLHNYLWLSDAIIIMTTFLELNLSMNMAN